MSSPHTPRHTAGPVYVDSSGRRLLVRRAGWALLAGVVACAVLVVTAGLGGPSLQAPFLPKGPITAGAKSDGQASPGETSTPTPTTTDSSSPTSTGSPSPTTVRPRAATSGDSTDATMAATSARPTTTAPSPTPAPTRSTTTIPTPAPSETERGKSANAPGATKRPTPTRNAIEGAVVEVSEFLGATCCP